MRLYRRLLRFLRPHRRRMVETVVGSTGAAILDTYAFALLIPFLNALFGSQQLLPQSETLRRILGVTIGRVLDPTDKMGSLQNIILVILTTVVVKNLLTWFSAQAGAQLQEYVTRDLRDTIYRHIQRLPLGYFTQTKTGQLISRVLSDTDQTRALITAIVTQALQSAALAVAYLVLLFAISWRLTLIALIVAPLLLATLQPLLRKLRRGYRAVLNDHGEFTSVLHEVVTGIRLVKAFRAEAYEDRRFTEVNARFSNGVVRVTRISYMSQPITEVLGTCITVGLLWFGARLVLVDGTMQGAQLIVFLTVVMRLLQPLKQLSTIPAAAQQSLAAAERIFEVLDTPPETASDHGTRDVDGFRDSIVFDDVSFAYEEEPVLSHVSFRATKGDVVALVGPSGAGKSTLVDLIPRFYEPTAGRILFDGIDAREIRLESLRSLTGIVSQDTVLFNDTVRSNIAYGAEGKFTDAQVEAAARAANAHAFIAELPKGYDTLLGERGARLSGGQRQRIAIARALLVDPPVLILDEATSALDTESERLVQEAIDRLLEGRTVFVIAHRLSTVVHADQILVLDRGRIIERGTHAELLARRGAYFRLYTMQFRGPDDPDGSVSPVAA